MQTISLFIGSRKRVENLIDILSREKYDYFLEVFIQSVTFWQKILLLKEKDILIPFL